METRRREEGITEIGTKRPLRCAVDISTRKRILPATNTTIVTTITTTENGNVHEDPFFVIISSFNLIQNDDRIY